MILLAIFGAFLWRLRGGLLNDLTGKANWIGFNDTAVRMCWATGMAVTFWFVHPEYRDGLRAFAQQNSASVFVVGMFGYLLLLISLFAGTTIIGWFGAALYPVKWRDIGLLSLSGFLRMTFPAIVLLSPWPLVAGALCGPVYWLGSRIPHPRPWMFWGEILFGATVGLFLGVS